MNQRDRMKKERKRQITLHVWTEPLYGGSKFWTWVRCDEDFLTIEDAIKAAQSELTMGHSIKINLGADES